jgi:hypothetical protein
MRVSIVIVYWVVRGGGRLRYKSESVASVELVVHEFDGLHEAVSILGLHPLLEGAEVEARSLLLSSQPPKIMNKDVVAIFSLEDPINYVATEQLQLQTTS